MEKNKLIVIIIILLICILGATNLIINLHENYKSITINEVKMEVPPSNTTISNITNHYTEYNDTSNGVYVYVFDSEGTSLMDAPEMFQFLSIRDINQLESITFNEENCTYNYSSSLNEYTYLDNHYHKSIFIITKKEDVMQHILKSLNYDMINNTTNNTNNSQEKIVEKVVNSHPRI